MRVLKKAVRRERGMKTAKKNTQREDLAEGLIRAKNAGRVSVTDNSDLPFMCVCQVVKFTTVN